MDILTLVKFVIKQKFIYGEKRREKRNWKMFKIFYCDRPCPVCGSETATNGVITWCIQCDYKKEIKVVEEQHDENINKRD